MGYVSLREGKGAVQGRRDDEPKICQVSLLTTSFAARNPTKDFQTTRPPEGTKIKVGTRWTKNLARKHTCSDKQWLAGNGHSFPLSSLKNYDPKSI